MIPAFQENDIERLAGHRSLHQGWDYYRSGAVAQAYRQGSVLKASCIGSARTPYQVRVTFNEQGIADAYCTCPIGEKGRCKHVAALLICWRESPQAFAEIEPWDAVLARASRRELIEAIRSLVQRNPELEDAIETLLPRQETPAEAPSPETYRGRVADLIARSNDTPESAAYLAGQLLAIKEAGDQLAKSHDPAAAAAVYQAIIGELLEHPERLDHHHTELVDLVSECVESMGLCLAQLRDDPQSRLGILRTLLDLYRFDVVLGGIALGSDVSRVILAHVAAEEQPVVADWIRGLLPAIENRASRRIFGGLLLELMRDQLTEAEFFDTCRRSERMFDLVRRLIQTDRREQALEETLRADDHELIQIADLLVHRRQEAAAQRLVQERAAVSDEPCLRQWLQDDEVRRRDLAAMLDLSQRLFRMQPTFTAYRQIRALARQCGKWDSLRPELLTFIERSGYLPLLVRIHLEENDMDRALEVVIGDGPSLDDGSLALRVARAVERAHPLESLHVYQTVAERLIARRGRENYAKAVRCLRKVRALFSRTGNARKWTTYLQDLRRRHRPLRTLFEELDTQHPTEDPPA